MHRSPHQTAESTPPISKATAGQRARPTEGACAGTKLTFRLISRNGTSEFGTTTCHSRPRLNHTHDASPLESNKPTWVRHESCGEHQNIFLQPARALLSQLTRVVSSNVGQQTDISSDRFTSADAVHDARRQAGSGVRQRTKTTRVNELFGTKMNQARDRAALRKRDTLATIRNDVRARDNLPRLKPQTIC